MASASSDQEKMLLRLQEVNREYSKKKRKLKRSAQASKARAHVRQRIDQQLAEQHVNFPDISVFEPYKQLQESIQNDTTGSGESYGQDRQPDLVCPENHTARRATSPGYSQDMFISPSEATNNTSEDCIGNSQNDKYSALESVKSTDDSPLIHNKHEKFKLSQSNVTPVVSKYKKKNFVTKLTSSPNSANHLHTRENLKSNSPQVGEKSSQKFCEDATKDGNAFKRAQAIVYERQALIKAKVQTLGDICANSCSPGDIKSTLRKQIVSARPVMQEFQCNAVEVQNTDSDILLTKTIFDLNKSENLIQKESPVGCLPDSNSKNINNKSKQIIHTRKRRSSSGLGVQRRSTRIAEHSSQDTLSQDSSKVTSPVFADNSLARSRKPGRPATRTPRVSKKQVIISSMFQCLVDEGRRKNDVEDFSLPDDYLDCCLETCIQGVNINSEAPVLENGTSEHDHLDCEVDSEVLFLGPDIVNKHNQNKNKLCLKNRNTLTLKHKDNSQPSMKSDQINFSSVSNQNVVSAKMELSDIHVTEVRPCDQCISANNSKCEEITSPSLFESQTNTTEAFTFDNTKLLARDKGPIGEAIDTHIGTYNDNIDNTTSKNIQLVDGIEAGVESRPFTDHVTHGGASVAMVTEVKDQMDEKGDTGIIMSDTTYHLQQTAVFQVPSGETIHSMVFVDTPGNYIACLCQTALMMFSHKYSCWSCIATHPVKTNLRKKTGQMLYSLGDCDTVSVVLLENQSNSTAVCQYTLHDTSLQKRTVHIVQRTNVLVCPLAGNQLLVASYQSGKTCITKFTQSSDPGLWAHDVLDSTDKQLAGLIQVHDLQAAVLGFTSNGTLLIWNHKCGALLSTVDMMDVCPSDPVCPQAFHEQGFLILPMLSRRRRVDAGCLVVVNPNLGSSETLLSLQHNTSWNGCTSVSVLSDLLLVRGNNGIVGIWDLHTGSYLATIDDITITCLTAANQHVALGHKHCVHIYNVLQ